MSASKEREERVPNNQDISSETKREQRRATRSHWKATWTPVPASNMEVLSAPNQYLHAHVPLEKTNKRPFNVATASHEPTASDRVVFRGCVSVTALMFHAVHLAQRQSESWCFRRFCQRGGKELMFAVVVSAHSQTSVVFCGSVSPVLPCCCQCIIMTNGRACYILWFQAGQTQAGRGYCNTNYDLSVFVLFCFLFSFFVSCN